MNETWYLLDNNALVTLSREQRAGEFVRRRCRIPTEVLHEAQGYPDIAALRQLEFEMNAEILEHVRLVMAAERPGDLRLVDLYSNKGNADPILIATALHARTRLEDTLLPDEWVVVTNDRAVTRTAAAFGVPTLTSEQFRDLL